MRRHDELSSTTNPMVFRRVYKSVVAEKKGLCDRCGWHRGENRLRTKHGTQKPKHKDHR